MKYLIDADWVKLQDGPDAANLRISCIELVTNQLISGPIEQILEQYSSITNQM